MQQNGDVPGRESKNTGDVFARTFLEKAQPHDSPLRRGERPEAAAELQQRLECDHAGLGIRRAFVPQALECFLVGEMGP